MEERIGRKQLKLCHLYSIAWGLRDLHDELLPSTPVPPLVDRLVGEGARRCRVEETEELVATLQGVSFISVRGRMRGGGYGGLAEG